MSERGATAVPALAAGGPAVAFGSVWHRRNRPAIHEFRYPVTQIWLDPDRPGELFDRHPLWSTRARRPIRFRPRDHLDGSDTPIGPRIRAALEPVLGREPTGPVRLLAQPRIWGWLFNPIAVHLAWDLPAEPPVGVVLEVTNTPWKERTLYPLALARDPAPGTGPGPGSIELAAGFDKTLHVSPFLDRDLRYHFRIGERLPDRSAGDRRLTITIDVARPDRPDAPVVETALAVHLRPPDRRTMTAALTNAPLSTHRVSAGIHLQALRLATKRVPFVPHPSRRS
ncbi:MAG: DUF1365 domain-containing protein [Actinomycetota bacterium]